jgi:metal-responsive CopG/Arc/MetJ family transcriptional regulator
MKPLLIQLDEQTLEALNRVAAPGKRMRSEFVRAQYQAISEGYRKQPDSLNGDDWSTN